MLDLEAYRIELAQEVALDAQALGQFTEDAFFDKMTAQMVDAGELDGAERVHFAKRGMQADGYGGPPGEDPAALTLLLVDHATGPDIQTLTAKDLDTLFRRGRGFVEGVLDGKLTDAIEETSPAFDLADLTRAHWKRLHRLRLCVITNRRLSKRVDGMESEPLRGVPVVYSVWDLERSFSYANSRSEREDISVDFEGEFGGALPVLPAHLDEAAYEAYLAVIPGAQLARIYDRWGTRLLEQNVRVFLQARGSVNKGIKQTIEQTPEMFFSYNNGISATAEGVEVRRSNGGTVITSIRNLQIVNGGQTTASIHAAFVRGDPGVGRVFVQMKLSIIPAEEALAVVPKISEYANSQNKVSAADFFSNHPFHVRMEEFSRRVVAPAPEGAFVGSKWFYERARGQFNDARARATGAQKKRFDQEFPKAQLFTKTDLAKYSLAWDGLPHVVSKGAQKNFVEFAKTVSDRWDKNADTFNEEYYQHAVAKAIGFKYLERLVSQQEWYEGGYRANIVAYACAKLGHDAACLGLAMNFQRIWRAQGVGEALHEAMVIAAKRARDVLVDPPLGSQNVTEWAKQQAAWERLRNAKVEWPTAWVDSLQTAEQAKAATAAAAKDQKLVNDVQALQFVVEAGGEFWARVREWGQAHRMLSSKELDILAIAAKLPHKLPTDQQCKVLLKALARLQEEGCPEVLPRGG